MIPPRLAELSDYRQRRAAGERCCLGCGAAIPSALRSRCPVCTQARRAAQQRRHELNRPPRNRDRTTDLFREP